MIMFFEADTHRIKCFFLPLIIYETKKKCWKKHKHKIYIHKEKKDNAKQKRVANDSRKSMKKNNVKNIHINIQIFIATEKSKKKMFNRHSKKK